MENGLEKGHLKMLFKFSKNLQAQQVFSGLLVII